MWTKNTAIVLCILVLSDQFLIGLLQNDDEREMEIQYEHKKGDDGDGGDDGGDDDGGPQPTENSKKGLQMDVSDNGVANGGRFGASGGPMGNIVGTGSQTIKKGTMSGLARVLDDRASQIDTFGNLHGGMPQDLIGHVRYCAQFIYSGLYFLIYVIIRYPLKLLSKAIILTGALSFIKSYAMWCINPIVMMDFTTEGKKINGHLEKLAEFKDEFKKRMIWTTDKARHEDRQMYACCSWQEYKRKIYEEAPESLRFSQGYHRGLFKLIELVYCMKYQEGSRACEETDLSPANEEPERVVPQSMYVVAFELFDKFI